MRRRLSVRQRSDQSPALGRSSKSGRRKPVRPDPCRPVAGVAGDVVGVFIFSSAGNNAYDGLAATYDGVHGPWQTISKFSYRTFAAEQHQLQARRHLARAVDSEKFRQFRLADHVQGLSNRGGGRRRSDHQRC